MSRKLQKYISILLTVALTLSVVVFSASAATPYITVAIECSGDGQVSNGATSGTEHISRNYSVGDTVTLTATPSEQYEFLFWKNQDTQRIVSYDEEYTFTATTYRYLEAVFDLEQDIMNDEDDMHTVIYLSQADNVLSMQQVRLGSTNVGQPVSNPLIAGQTFSRWDKTPEEVAAESGRVFVRPVYSSTASYAISTVVDGVKRTQEVEYGTEVTVKAPQNLNGQDFSYWVNRAKDDTMEDVIVSYYAEYTFVVTVSTTIEAVYGEGRGTGIATRIAGDIPNFEKCTISFFSEHSVTEDYTVLENGLIMTRNISIGNSEERFKIDPNDTTTIRKGTSKYNENYGSYGITMTNWTATMVSGGQTVTYYPLLFLRSYVIVKDKSGNIITQYSPIYVVDYVNEKFVGELEGDNFQDPFG